MKEIIPLATPYPWDNPAMKEAQLLTNQKLRKRRFVGSGFVALQKGALGPTSDLDDDSQSLLQNLLYQRGVEIDTKVANTSIADKMFGFMTLPDNALSKKPADIDSDDTEVLKGAQCGEISLFLTILKVISDSGSTPVSTKELFRACCLAVRSRDIPGSMDAKEMVMAALHFMSRDCEIISEDLISLPLIRPPQELADLERRTFSKCGDWTMDDDDFVAKVLRLEQIFTSSSSSWRWLKREYVAPRLAQKDEDSLFFKGMIPASAAAKKPVQQTASRKRKSDAMSSRKSDSIPSPRAGSPRSTQDGGSPDS